MMNKNNHHLSQVAKYYTSKVNEFGATPKGVDWNGEESQLLRFTQLCKLLPVDVKAKFSINDLGCGYAALYDFLANRYRKYSYVGYDVSDEMISVAENRLQMYSNAIVKCASEVDEFADYGIASGIFNVRLDTHENTWLEYILSTLDNLNEYCEKGFSFNCLTSYSDTEKKRNDLYYADPEKLFNITKKHYSRNVALLHDYNLYEFTILVRKT